MMKVEELSLLFVALAFCTEIINGFNIINNDNETEHDVVYKINPIGRPPSTKEIHSLDDGVKKVPMQKLTARSNAGNELLNDFGKKHYKDDSMDSDYRKLYEPELYASDSSLEARNKDYNWYDDEGLKKLMNMIDELIEPAEKNTSKIEVKERISDKFKDKIKSSKEIDNKTGTENSESHHQHNMQGKLDSIPVMDDAKERLKVKITNESINDIDKLINETKLIKRILESEQKFTGLNKIEDSSNDKNNGRTPNTHTMDELGSRNLPDTDYDKKYKELQKKLSENLTNGDRLIGRNKQKLKNLPENEKLLDDLVSLYEMQTHMNDSNGRSIYIFGNRQKDNNEFNDSTQPDFSTRRLTDEEKPNARQSYVNNNAFLDYAKKLELMGRKFPDVKLIEIDATKLPGENKAINKLKKIIKGKKKSGKKHRRKNNFKIEEENVTKEIPNGQELLTIIPQIQPVTLHHDNNNTDYSNMNNINLNKESQNALEINNNLTGPKLTENKTDNMKNRASPVSTIEREINKNTTDQNNDQAGNFTTSNKFENNSISVMPETRSFESYSNNTDVYKNYDDAKLNREVEEIMKLLADDELTEKENNELMERSASEVDAHDLFPESYEMGARRQLDPESYKEIRLQMMKQLLSMEGPKECKKTRNLNNVVYPDAKSISNQVSYYDTERNLKEIEEHETYLCIDPPKYPDYFFKLQTVIKVVPKKGEGPEVIKAIERKYYDYNGREFNWEPETPNSNSS